MDSILDFIELEESTSKINSYDSFVWDHVREIIRSIRQDIAENHESKDLEDALMKLETLTSTLYYMTVFGLLSKPVYENLYSNITSTRYYFRHRFKGSE